jgi:hypothetical protein
MKSKVIGISLLLALFSACQKESDLPELVTDTSAVNNVLTTDMIHNTLARVVALSLEDNNARLFLHEEIGKQFTGDYDILYDIIKGKEILSEKFGNVSFASYLESVAGEHEIDFSPVRDYLAKCKNLQISCPVFYKDWDPASMTPLVIGLPVDYNEGGRMPVKGYDLEGGENICFEEDIVTPVLLVRIAERVDAEGMMRVDPDGFVIPEEERTVTAREAYDYAVEHLKSAGIWQTEPVIEVVGNDEFMERLVSRRSMYSYPEGEPSIGTGKILDPGLKSATATAISAPSTFSVFPAGPYTIQLSWSQVPGAVSYEIYRQYMTYPNYLLATVGSDQINYYDQYLGTDFGYTYSIRAVDASGNASPLTNGLESYASWRTNGNRDVIDKIFIDSDCWKWCCGLFDGKIELQYKTSYLTLPGNTNTAYPGVGVNSLGQKTKDQQKNKWCYYNHYLFPWDVRTKSYSYRIVMVEDDGAGDGTTIKLGLTFKVQIFKIVDISAPLSIEFKIADKDESFGEVIIQYWERKGGPLVNGIPSDGYNLIPDKGKARMYLK